MSISAPSPSFEIPKRLDPLFSSTIAAEFAYFTPKGLPLCWPVTPYWYPERGVFAIATGLGYPTKADYPKKNPMVSLFFSDARSIANGEQDPVLIKGTATVLDDDIQANTDRYVIELRRKFQAAKIGINRLTMPMLDWYLPRIWVEITPKQLVIGKGSSAEIIGDSQDQHSEDPVSISELQPPELDDSEVDAVVTIAKRFREAVAVTGDGTSPPSMLRTEVEPRSDGTLRLFESPPNGHAALSFHKHSIRGTRFQAHMLRGDIHEESFGSPVFIPTRVVGFFGNGALFPLSVVTKLSERRSSLRRELSKRGLAMPKLRVPPGA